MLDLIAACNLIPGPNSTELAIHIGHRKAGWPGLLVADACFILPAALLVGAIAWAYVMVGVAPVVPLVKLFGVFAKIGAVLFGSGYVLLAFLRTDLVDRLHWLSESQLLDAVAVGQITPGPVFTTATFIGYLLGGGRGAVVATVGIFLPAFVFVAISGPLVPRIRRSRVAGAFLDGVVVASLALMAVVAVQLGQAAILDPWTIAILVISVVVLQRTKVSSLVLIVGGAASGLAVHALGV